MTDRIKLRRLLSRESIVSQESETSKPLRPSHQKIIENLDRWANSHELQPPKAPDSRRA